MRLYIIGPVTGIEKDNKPAFEDARRLLIKKGYIAHTPHDVAGGSASREDAMTMRIDNLTIHWAYIGGRVEGRRYGGVALLDGWEQSRGASLEKAVAEACGIPCKTVDEWLEKADAE